jgi:AcrR family transcriptional regulator
MVLPLRERNKQRVTQRIIAAAMELFKARGCQQTTMDDIAAKAEISRGTLFNYFPSKDALLLPWGQEILQQYVQPKLTAYLETQPSTIQVLQFLFAGMSENFPASPDVIRAFMDEALKPKNKPHMELARTGTLGIIAQVLRYGQARGEVRTDIPLETMANYVGALQAGLLFRLLESTQLEEDSSQEIARLLLFMEAGLAVPSEPK